MSDNLNSGQTIYGTSIDCPKCHHEEEGLHTDGRYYWCNQCGWGKDTRIKDTDLPDIPKQTQKSEDNLGI